MAIKPHDIAKLVELFEESDWDELHVEMGGLQLFLSSDPNARLTSSAAALATYNAPEQPAARMAMSSLAPQQGAPGISTSSEAPILSTKSEPTDEIPENWVAVNAPHLATFYRAPKPGAPPYVEVGQEVSADTEICLLEVMKLFTSLRAGVDGIIRRVCAEDAELVEGEQILFYIERT